MIGGCLRRRQNRRGEDTFKEDEVNLGGVQHMIPGLCLRLDGVVMV